MRTTTLKQQQQRTSAYLEMETPPGPVLLPRFWWMAFAFAVPFILAGSALILVALWHHSGHSAEHVVMRFGSIAGFAGLAVTAWFYWSLVGRPRH